MSPSRSRKSSSRRSSILKLPKPRQALQNLNDNSSSNENSPANTLKFKRRVSFAEKKHVKEFCNSVEQGTVWDTTYEEHDLSNLKMPSTSNQEEDDIHIVHKENIVYFNQENNVQFLSNVMTEKDLNVKDNGRKSRDLSLSQTETSANSNNLNATSIQNIHMEFTEVVSRTVYRDVNYIQNNKLEETLQNTSMELTQPIYSSMNTVKNFQQEHNVKELNSQSKLNNFNVTAVDPNASMELTLAVPSIIKPVEDANKADLLIYSESNRTKRFDNVSMEITTPVPSVPVVLHRLQQPVDNISMEITAPVPSMSSVPHSLQQPVTNNEIGTCGSMIPVGNKTIIFHDNSMEITSAVKTQANRDTNRQFDEGNRSTVTEEADFKYDNEKTKVLNMSMEMTEAMNMDSIVKSQERKEINCKITDTSIENDLRKVRSYLDCYKTSTNPDKTNMYDNEAMEFTEAIGTSPKNNLKNTEHVRKSQWNNDGKDNSVNLVSNKTAICQNNSMTITNIVSPLNMKDGFENVTEVRKSNINNSELIKTIVYPNISMDITEDEMVSQCRLPKNNTVINSVYVSEPVLFENEDKDLLDSYVVHGNILNQITSTVVLSPSKSNLIMDKEMHLANDSLQCLKRINTKTAALTEHDLEQQDVNSLSLKENIREKIYVLHSPTFHNPSSIVIPEVNPHKQSQNIISNPEKTYTIQPINIDHSCNKEDDKTSCTRNSLNNTGNLQNNGDEHLTEEDAMFFNNTLEELHTITPPSFVCLEESDSDTPVDVDMEVNPNSNNINNSEATEEENISANKCNLENISDIHEETLKVDEVAGVKIKQINEDCSGVHLNPRLESHESSEQKDMSIELDPFSSLMNKLKICAQSDEIIWEVYHENIERNLFVIGFVSSSLLVVIYLKDNFDALGNELIKEIKIYSRLADDVDALMSLVHRIIMEKLDAQVLADLCKNCEDIFSILDNISTEVKLAMDFMFDVERIRDINLMEITRDRVSFIAFAKRKDIILRVTIDIKPFNKIESKDISVHCRLGSVRKEDVKRLITNIKRDHKFLRRYINDVNDYIYLMEESVNIIKR